MANNPEQELFDELAKLCGSPGYAHAIAHICFRDNFVGYSDQLTSDDYAKLFSPDRLIRTEVSTILGLMLREKIDLALPTQEELGQLIKTTETLLSQIHKAMNLPTMEAMEASLAGSGENPFAGADALRETIFYGGEAAYSFQYRDLAPRKYAADDEWLVSKKGFSIEQGREIVAAIGEFQNTLGIDHLQSLQSTPLEEWSMLGTFKLNVEYIVDRTRLDRSIVEAFLDAFSITECSNSGFVALSEFNEIIAFPILKHNDGYYLFQYVGLTEALYDTPYYWLNADEQYQSRAAKNRGEFTETIAAEFLERAFGRDRVYRNVKIWRSSKETLGEIDVLVLFADRAIVVQAKSKKLTLAARKGNDLQLQGDFKGAVQDAVDQAYNCAQAILESKYRLSDASGNTITLQAPLKQVHPVCVVSDNYPALSFQCQQFLKYETSTSIGAPLVCDLFTLDAVTEMLDTPLRCLSYLELRAIASDNILMSHELVALSYHLRQNLWLDEHDYMLLEDNIAASLDVAMAVRRDGVSGDPTPDGILTRMKDTVVGGIISGIEDVADPAAVAIGLQLLQLGEDTIHNLGTSIENIARATKKDGKPHDITLGFGTSSSGLTVHCNLEPDEESSLLLETHCEVRKYSQKADTWYGLTLDPTTLNPRFGLALDFPWEHSDELEKAAKSMPAAKKPKDLQQAIRQIRAGSRKLGRNDLCHCGSGKKYKKCCLEKDKASSSRFFS